MEVADKVLTTILLVDDDDTFRQRLSMALQRRGYRVLEAASSQQARNVCSTSQQQIDACIVDLKMPQESGLELVNWIHLQQPQCRTLILTGYGSIATAVEAIRLGAADYLTKPANADQILAALLRQAEEGPTDLPPPEHFPSLDQVEWDHLHRVLHDCNGNISMAARKLGIERRSLQRKLQKAPP